MLEVLLTDTDEGLACLRSDWNRLLEASSNASIFLTWEWVAAWWKAYGAGKVLRVLKVERNGSPIGLAPLYLAKFRYLGVCEYRGLYFIGDGSGDSDYLDVIARTGEEETVAQAIAAYLMKQRSRWDVIFLNEVPAESVTFLALQQFLVKQGCYWRESDSLCVSVPLPHTWEDYVKSLKPRMRTKIRSLMRQLEQSAEIRFDRCQHSDDLAPRLDSLFELHGRRWREKHQDGVFLSPTKRIFYGEMSSLFLSRGWLRLYSLAVNNQYVAHQYCFEYQNQLFLLQEGYDPQWETHGIGNVLRAYVFRDCIEKGIATYDFLGGVTSHKLSWGGVVKKSVRSSIGLRGAKNKIFFSLPELIERGKENLKIIIPEPAVAWIQGVRRRGSLSPNGAQRSSMD